MSSIIVRGSGSISAAPDMIRLELDMQSRSTDCGQAMEKAEDSLAELRGILESCGFEKDALRTSGFDVRTEYESLPDEKGNYRSVFRGYCCAHQMNVEFPLDTVLLAEMLRRISASKAAPQLSVQFTVKDTESAKEELIRITAADARKKAELLCQASGVTLGRLIRISYDRAEKNMISQTRYGIGNDCLCFPAKAVSIEPADVKLSDSAEFEWEII